ncbi:gephyrin-like molybdotransferase receptor GlpR [Mycobacterium sp. 852002-51163_SCH5372311]|uniref:divisome protein SepX/GlpR n=1 Tax=Mycobacterium sp. 852002-51163_SCH5372311 TaxID=1834097 RepID=UPI000AEF30EF|nr:gephyrin-like molybdotransferase receptor GlpR [Mycobacterium sp. 852002-51163_SCH5372311]
MPSIPQSLLWISLVVLWLFVLVPMLISKRDAVRRTSDVALATRVLNGGAGSRLLKRSGPAAGHRSNPDWKPEDEWEDEPVDGTYADADQEQDEDEQQDVDDSRPVVMKRAAAEDGEPDYLDVDVVEDSAALPAGAEAVEPVAADEDAEESEPEAEAEPDADEYEYVEDSSGLEPEEDDEESSPPVAPAASRRRRFDTKTAAAVSARKYAFRKRMLVAMAVILVGSAITAFEVSPAAWWACGTATAITVLYLGYLRRQTRIEEKIRRRRAQRMARARLGVENAYDREFEVVPSRLRRPGAVVLEIDDEDPIFEHLDDTVSMRNFGWPRDLPRAVGQ